MSLKIPEPLKGWKLHEDPKYPEYWHPRTNWTVCTARRGGWIAERGAEDSFDIEPVWSNDPTVLMEICSLSIDQDISC